MSKSLGERGSFMDESKKEILEKEKIYHEMKKARTPIYIVIGWDFFYKFAYK